MIRCGGFLALYGKQEITPQAHRKAEGQKLSGLSTSEHRQVRWDDELMQSPPARFPLPLIRSSYTTLNLLYFSFPLCLILFSHSYLFVLPYVLFFFFFFLHKPFLCHPLILPPPVSPLSPHHRLRICAARK